MNVHVECYSLKKFHKWNYIVWSVWMFSYTSSSQSIVGEQEKTGSSGVGDRNSWWFHERLCRPGRSIFSRDNFRGLRGARARRAWLLGTRRWLALVISRILRARLSLLLWSDEDCCGTHLNGDEWDSTPVLLVDRRVCTVLLEAESSLTTRPPAGLWDEAPLVGGALTGVTLACEMSSERPSRAFSSNSVK